MSEIKTFAVNAQTTQSNKWLCSECRFTLAFVEGKKIIRIKRKDLYVEVEGGRVKVICCRCGKPNELHDDGEQK